MNEILDQQNGSRTYRQRRAPFKIIGTLANLLFGIVDQNSAQRNEDKIEGIRGNKKLFCELLRNQSTCQDDVDNRFNLILKELDEI